MTRRAHQGKRLYGTAVCRWKASRRVRGHRESATIPSGDQLLGESYGAQPPDSSICSAAAKTVPSDTACRPRRAGSAARYAWGAFEGLGVQGGQEVAGAGVRGGDHGFLAEVVDTEQADEGLGDLGPVS
ncbi:hypothetical protein [Streptomyces sp. NBC_00829]|uniref:hypothetical protein n=1 Tax=Streptomyces sp. NBC_00829 TaxID=2903679 RepID=UPI00386EAD6F|nr:hypothetical protein OG293_37795 [Streptomyces sp. NBC_00829]